MSLNFVLTRWQHAVLSILILFSLVVLLWMSAVKPFTHLYREKVDTLNDLRAQVQKFNAVAAQRKQLIPLFEQEKNTAQQTVYFLPRTAPSLAAAKLQERIKNIVNQHKAQLISTQVVPSKSEEVFTPVEIMINIKSDIRSLQQILHTIESAKPITFIDNLQIQYLSPIRRQNEKDQEPQPIILNVYCNLRVYMMNEVKDEPAQQ